MTYNKAQKLLLILEATEQEVKEQNPAKEMHSIGKYLPQRYQLHHIHINYAITVVAHSYTPNVILSKGNVISAINKDTLFQSVVRRQRDPTRHLVLE